MNSNTKAIQLFLAISLVTTLGACAASPEAGEGENTSPATTESPAVSTPSPQNTTTPNQGGSPGTDDDNDNDDEDNNDNDDEGGEGGEG